MGLSSKHHERNGIDRQTDRQTERDRETNFLHKFCKGVWKEKRDAYHKLEDLGVYRSVSLVLEVCIFMCPYCSFCPT